MDLSDGGGAQGLLLKHREQLLQRHAAFGLHHLLYLEKGHGADLRAQQRQLLTIGGGQHIPAHGQNLPQLDKGRTQILHNGAELLRRQTADDIMLCQNSQNFP